MYFRRLASSMAALVLVSGTLVAGAGSASANQVWYQSVGKASAEAPCPTSTGTELAAGWTQWSSSWAMWANQGRGGFVCDREITWAYSETTPTPSGPGCVPFQLAVGDFLATYLQFGSSNVIPVVSAKYLRTADCSGVATTIAAYLVFALTRSEAIVLCGDTLTPFQEAFWNPNVYRCIFPA
jgi:hypothetical protein